VGYELQAVIAAERLLRSVSQAVPHARVVGLGQGLALLPMLDDLFDTTGDRDADTSGCFWKLPHGFADVLARWSAAGPIAYVEADYFGGIGSQCAAVWDGGVLVFGPLHLPVGRPVNASGTPISQALRRLGVTCHGRDDEFDAVGLGRHRHTEDWTAEEP
jgi:hypothetical protein